MNTPLILDGKALAKSVEQELAVRVERIKEKTGTTPILATIIVGDDPASVTYVRMKGNACARIGMQSLKVELPEETTTEQLIARIQELNNDDNVHGILLQHPVPAHIDELACFLSIDVSKDVDGVNPNTFGRMALQMDSFKCATPYGIITLLKHYNIQIEGKEAVVIGRSPILGKPVAMMLLNENATVTICHSRTKDLPSIVRRADIVVAAVGKPRFVQADWVKEGCVLVDAGYNPGNIGDIDLENAVSKCSAYTPVPGGVGPMTINRLIYQTVESAEKKLGLA
ncbi:MAG: tetrahydrofolate dehydrogenase/cyclohydrolase catalytic domain-containing protein [Acetivibrionales bacterium]|jgi:methylenetetrahydrofolate dehydrogenase (NADP+)/methenyltetrahydrofolate cyclohydrolase|nr:tetrahydrofolate dehydrogenase/cyclohydrolase catalytic domain-containing protein [Clostridiales bacterium]HPZ05090.1 tetrahydrofolate dehydrogenase/cyclohydrolase catalytic domain-containing protein [Clostridiales bacterium]HQD30253.1 tetrahydrofolate dehydrogenase/cyclohydrolase catalytic domain-containing protein [Clostridiales bacterium]